MRRGDIPEGEGVADDGADVVRRDKRGELVPQPRHALGQLNLLRSLGRGNRHETDRVYDRNSCDQGKHERPAVAPVFRAATRPRHDRVLLRQLIRLSLDDPFTRAQRFAFPGFGEFHAQELEVAPVFADAGDQLVALLLGALHGLLLLVDLAARGLQDVRRAPVFPQQVRAAGVVEPLQRCKDIAEQVDLLLLLFQQREHAPDVFELALQALQRLLTALQRRQQRLLLVGLTPLDAAVRHERQPAAPCWITASETFS